MVIPFNLADKGWVTATADSYGLTYRVSKKALRLRRLDSHDLPRAALDPMLLASGLWITIALRMS